jgi:hypothetical protein
MRQRVETIDRYSATVHQRGMMWMDMKRSRKLYYLDPNEYSNIINPVIELTWARCYYITQGRLQLWISAPNCVIRLRHLVCFSFHFRGAESNFVLIPDQRIPSQRLDTRPSLNPYSFPLVDAASISSSSHIPFPVDALYGQ